MMHIYTGVEVSIRLIVTVWAPQNSLPHFTRMRAFASVGEPLPRDCRIASKTALVPWGSTSDRHHPPARRPSHEYTG